MGGYFQVVALDLDGTLTSDGSLCTEVLRAVDEARDRGLRTVLATGRIREEMLADHPDVERCFDGLVLENGALVGPPDDLHPVAPPVEQALADRLAAAGVPHRCGRCILALSGAHTGLVTQAIADLGLDCQLMHNRAELMVLPAGVSKGTGLRSLLELWGVSAHNTICAGDAENDLALLEVAEVGVAVADATASLRAHADIVLDAPGGRGVVELLAGPVVDGTTAVHAARRRVRIGEAPDGSVVTVPGAQATIVVCGGSGAGKSRLAGLLVERWHAAGYTVLVVDPEGDHVGLARLPGMIALSPASPPDIAEIVAMLRQDHLSVVLDLSGLDPTTTEPYLRQLGIAVGTSRSVYGLPHWVVVDEAHGPLRDLGALAAAFRVSERGHCLVTFQPDRLWTPALTTADVVLTALCRPATVGRRVGAATAGYRLAGGVDSVFVLDDRVTAHTRHGHKYVAVQVPPSRRFLFRRASGDVVRAAGSLPEFVAGLAEVDDESIRHHGLRGDFSRWLVGVVQDPDLAAIVGAVENDLAARIGVDVARARRRLVHELASRYADEDVAPERVPPRQAGRG